jgi:hypothetical protein
VGGERCRRKRLRARSNVDLLSLTAWQMALGGCGLVAIALLVPSRPVAFSGAFVAALLYIAGGYRARLARLAICVRAPSRGVAALALLSYQGLREHVTVNPAMGQE